LGIAKYHRLEDEVKNSKAVLYIFDRIKYVLPSPFPPFGIGKGEENAK
jgi:hypothetical protein